MFKNILKSLENQKQWDSAIEFMQQILLENPNDLDAHLCMNYLLMNLLVEESFDVNKQDYYTNLLKKYFDESYEQFSNNPEYLYYTALTAFMSEWYFNISYEEAEKMKDKAINSDPKNIIYQWENYYTPYGKKAKDEIKAKLYAQAVLDPNSEIQKILKTKGSLGEYILDMMTNWANRITGISKY